ncbi:MAG: hypothetical protein J6C78_06780 [Muribaculaceae bacterium]|nr:hypothetical protein [Muribaculaceae bacterium]
MKTLKIANLKIVAAGETTGRICYVLYPVDIPSDRIEEAAKSYGVTMAVITGMDWNNDLTPWPAAGEPPGSPDFRGEAGAFLSLLTDRVLPEVERELNIPAGAERTLAGVSLSGLFTLWQWMINDTFHNIISLSGSFWYEGFAEWIKAHAVSNKSGRAYFLLGDQEAKTKVKAFQPVQTDTEEIVGYLHENGVDDFFELVPGNHYQYGGQRLNRALAWMFRRPD